MRSRGHGCFLEDTLVHAGLAVDLGHVVLVGASLVLVGASLVLVGASLVLVGASLVLVGASLVMLPTGRPSSESSTCAVSTFSVPGSWWYGGYDAAYRGLGGTVGTTQRTGVLVVRWGRRSVPGSWWYGGDDELPPPPFGPMLKSQCYPRMMRKAATVSATLLSS